MGIQEEIQRVMSVQELDEAVTLWRYMMKDAEAPPSSQRFLCLPIGGFFEEEQIHLRSGHRDM